MQGPLGHLLAALDGVIAVHQHLGLDDRHQALCLTDGGVARQRMRVGGDARPRRDVPPDSDHCAPLGELGAQFHVFCAALGEAVETLGDFFAGAKRHVLGAGVHLDSGNRADAREQLRKGRAVGRFLPQRLVVEDHSGDMFAKAAGGKQHVAVGATVFLDVFDADALEALLDGSGRFVSSQDALAGRDHCLRDSRQFVGAHEFLLKGCEMGGCRESNILTREGTRFPLARRN